MYMYIYIITYTYPCVQISFQTQFDLLGLSQVLVLPACQQTLHNLDTTLIKDYSSSSSISCHVHHVCISVHVHVHAYVYIQHY